MERIYHKQIRHRERSVIHECSRRDEVVTWLEARPCDSEKASEFDAETMLRFPSLMEAMRAAQTAASDVQGKGQYWEYSIKLADTESDGMAELFDAAATESDARSERRTIEMRYNGKCYSLTLFTFKE